MASSAGKRAKRPCYIDSVPDPILAKIFSHLPHTERLHLSEMCSRWRDVARLDWLDVVDLDLTPIPSPNIGAVLRLSPNVETIFALRRFLIMNDLTEHYQINLTSVKLYDVKLGLASVHGYEFDTDEVEYGNLLAFIGGEDVYSLPAPEIEDTRNVSLGFASCLASYRELFAGALNRWLDKLPQLEELVLHNLSVTDLNLIPVACGIPFHIRTRQLSLSRLQLSGCGVAELFYPTLLSESLRMLPQLECLALHLVLAVGQHEPQAVDGEVQEAFRAAVASLKHLRELSLATTLNVYAEQCYVYHWPLPTAKAALELPNLEVLFLIGPMYDAASFEKLFTTHPKLRFLLLSGDCDDQLLPARKLNSTTASQPLPFLHVFLGQEARYSLHFTESAAAKIILFDAPIPEFLGSDEISALLDGVWVVEMIKETASYDPNFLESDANE